MKIYRYILIGVTMALNSCSGISSSDKPHLELIQTNPYQLKVTNFNWRYNSSDKTVVGNFEMLDSMVYELLKTKEGFCHVYLQYPGTDKYLSLSNIHIMLLNNSPTWRGWHSERGIQQMIQHMLIPKADMDSVKTDTIKQEPLHSQDATASYSKPANIRTVGYSYHFTIDDLYPTPQEMADLDQHRFNINGTIGDVNYSNGVFIINTTDGEQLTIQFNALNTSSEIGERLLLALKSGNKIKSVCARAGASTLDLVSADIAE